MLKTEDTHNVRMNPQNEEKFLPEERNETSLQKLLQRTKTAGNKTHRRIFKFKTYYKMISMPSSHKVTCTKIPPQ